MRKSFRKVTPEGVSCCGGLYGQTLANIWYQGRTDSQRKLRFSRNISTLRFEGDLLLHGAFSTTTRGFPNAMRAVRDVQLCAPELGCTTVVALA